MPAVFLVLIALGALISLVASVRALRAYFGYRRARAAFQGSVTDEVARLAERTGELESGLSGPRRARRGAPHPDLRAAAEPDETAHSHRCPQRFAAPGPEGPLLQRVQDTERRPPRPTSAAPPISRSDGHPTDRSPG
jgi:hypothetical protein